MTIRNPVVWIADQYKLIRPPSGFSQHRLHQAEGSINAPPVLRRITAADLKDVLAKGFDDFGANRTDVIFLCIVYPVIGLILARSASGYGLLPLLFPLAAGFTLLGPLAAVGLNEMSRRREQGDHVDWATPFGVLRSPSLGAIVVLGLLLIVIFLAWLWAAMTIYTHTLGPEPPASVASFIRAVFTTGPGWALVGVGVGVGFLFASLVLSISVISFPLLLDKDVGVDTAVRTSIQAMIANPGPMAVWGLIVAGSLVVGSIPLFVGLIIVLPVLGHATWHLYRKVVFY